MGFSKLESEKIYTQNVTCLERIFEIYTPLSEALDNISYEKMNKLEIIKEIDKQTYQNRLKSRMEYDLIFPQNSLNLL
ncbi:MAG: hypothetical protein JXA16_09105 [Bacteroidales bacterium]|nr:hypothetical protein [Bacteroidales bacterium]